MWNSRVVVRASNEDDRDSLDSARPIAAQTRKSSMSSARMGAWPEGHSRALVTSRLEYHHPNRMPTI